MKCKVRLTRTVELIVEGRDEETIMDWLRQTTPEEAFLAADSVITDDYDEAILSFVDDSWEADYIIKEEE